MRTVAVAAVLVWGWASAAGAQVLAGPPFRVNTFTLNEQKFGHPAIGPKGDFLISWSSLQQDGSGFGVYAQRFDALGTPQGGEFRVNTQAAGNQYSTSAVADAGGNYIIVWTNDSGNPDPSRDIFGRIFDPSGAPRTADFRVNAWFAGRQSSPAVAPLPGGNFVAVWESDQQDGSSFAVVGRLFDSRGNPLGGDFVINTFTPGLQAAPRITSDAAGNFTVVWHSENQDGSARGVFARRFDASASPLGGEFLVNTYTSNFQQYPVVSAVATANVPAGTTAPGGHPDAHGSLGLWPPGQAMTRVWRGEFSLAMTYWGFAQCGGLILAIPQLGLRVMGLNTAAQLVDGVAFAYSVVVIVGIWRSAGRYPGNPVWAHLARLATLMPLVVALLTMLGQGPGPGPG